MEDTKNNKILVNSKGAEDNNNSFNNKISIINKIIEIIIEIIILEVLIIIATIGIIKDRVIINNNSNSNNFNR
jgi:hypothetical protein